MSRVAWVSIGRGSGGSGLTTRRLLRRRDARMRFVEINLLGVYVAPISLLMVAAWVVTIGLRGSAARFGLLRHVYDQPKWFCHLNRVAQKTVGRLVSNDLTLETSCTDFLVYASAGMITV